MRTGQSERHILPKLMVLLAFMCVVVAGFAHWKEMKTAAAREQALQLSQPEIVPIEQLLVQPDMRPADEIRVTAQVDFGLKQSLEYFSAPGMPRAFMMPLLATTASGDAVPETLGLLMFRGDRADFTDAQLEQLLDGVVGMGSYGPIVELHGVTIGQGVFLPLIYKSLSAHGRSLSANAILIETFDAPRAIALKPQPAGASLILFGGFAATFLMIALLTFAYGKGKTARATQGKGAHVTLSPYAPETVGNQLDAAQLQEVLLPKTRQGTMVHAETEVYSPTKAAKANQAAPGQLHLTATTPVPDATEYCASKTGQVYGRERKGPAPADDRIGHLRLGPSIRDEIKLSKRIQAQLEADPFMQRLARMG